MSNYSNRPCPTIPSAKEQAIRDNPDPISDNNEPERLIPNLNISAILLNPDEINDWKGDIRKHKLRDSPKKTISKQKPLPKEHEQKIDVRYLQPPLPSPNGEIIIEEQHRPIPVPPLVIRIPRRPPCPPETKIKRDYPPKPPSPLPPVVIPVQGPDYYLPQRLVIEKFENFKTPPANYIIDKWLPYPTPPRRVTHRKDLPCLDHEENVEVIWPAPDYIIKKKITNLGVCCHQDPDKYLEKNQSNLSKDDEDEIDFELPPPPPNPCAHLPPNLIFENESVRQQFQNLDLATLKNHGLEMYAHFLHDKTN